MCSLTMLIRFLLFLRQLSERPMKIEIVLEPAPPPTLAQRVAPAPKATPIAANTGARSVIALCSISVVK
jgi:hypothetical protein